MELLKAFVWLCGRVGSDFVRASRNVATLTIVSTYFSSIASRSSETPAYTAARTDADPSRRGRQATSCHALSA